MVVKAVSKVKCVQTFLDKTVVTVVYCTSTLNPVIDFLNCWLDGKKSITIITPRSGYTLLEFSLKQEESHETYIFIDFWNFQLALTAL